MAANQIYSSTDVFNQSSFYNQTNNLSPLLQYQVVILLIMKVDEDKEFKTFHPK